MFQYELGRIEPTQQESAIIARRPPASRTEQAGRQQTNKQIDKHVPIIENLTPQYMPPHAPTVLVALLDQPIVPEHLRVEIKHLKGRVVDVVLGSREDEEAVVVDELVAAVQMHEGGHDDAVGPVQQVRGLEVEVAGPELEGFGKVGDAAAEVADFVDLGWTWKEGGLLWLVGVG